jgi:AIPR protein
LPIFALDGQTLPGVDVQLVLHQPAKTDTDTPLTMHYGLVLLSDLATLYQQHGKALVKANIREYKGRTKVNEKIQQTLQTSPDHFPYLNNGLTAYCKNIRIPVRDRNATTSKRLELNGFCIVNGAQTLGAINQSTQQANLQGYAFIKIISLEGCEDERAFAESITRATNLQNDVSSQDFASLDPEQSRIAEHLKLSGVFYHYRNSEDVPDSDNHNFTFDEALLALACLENSFAYQKGKVSTKTGKGTPTSNHNEYLCAYTLSNRAVLRSQETAYPLEPDVRSRYHRLFKPSRSARTIWRAVQTMRIVVSYMTDNAKDNEDGNPRRQLFFQTARWLVLNLVFLRLRCDQGEDLTLTASEQSAISREANLISEALWELVQHETKLFRTMFSNVNDCLSYKGRVLQQLPPHT